MTGLEGDAAVEQSFAELMRPTTTRLGHTQEQNSSQNSVRLCGSAISVGNRGVAIFRLSMTYLQRRLAVHLRTHVRTRGRTCNIEQ